jgi:hypothetical protein
MLFGDVLNRGELLVEVKFLLILGFNTNCHNHATITSFFPFNANSHIISDEIK